MAGCISEIPMWKDSACLSTELQMSNDPSTREVSSAAQGIKMAQIVTGISKKKWAVAFYRLVSQAHCLWRKKSIIWSLRFGTGFSLMLIILQLFLSINHCTGASSTPLSWCMLCFSPGLLYPLATSKLSALSFDLVTIHSEFAMMLFVTFLFQKHTLSSIHLSTFGDFVPLESGNLYAVISDTEACGTSHKDRCSSL